MKIAAYTPGKNIPSARFRIRQHIKYLSRRGIFINEFYPSKTSYPPINKSERLFWAAEVFPQRFFQALKSYRYELTLLQREMISTLYTFEPFTKIPRVLDVDDAIWNNGYSAVKNLSRCCDTIICGNNYLAENFSKWNKNIVVLPTAVDTKRFAPRSKIEKNMKIKRIVWSGSSSGFKYLYENEDVLETMLERHKNVTLRIVADKKPRFKRLKPTQTEFIKWSQNLEVEAIRSADLGIMPLAETSWERGKCSYKLLLYMACGLAVVASPVGMNAEILAMDSVGKAAKNKKEWIESLSAYIENPKIAYQDGRRGRKVVKKKFSCAVIAPKLADILLGII